ncbi:MAG: hypothetical protein AAGD38_05655 [Acidobacteriota bacterium]
MRLGPARLPFTLLVRYLFFLSRRPISSSNRHYLIRRLAGLQSLVPLIEPVLDERSPAELGEVLKRVASLTPASFRRDIDGVLDRLLAFLLTEEPEAVIASSSPPDLSFWTSTRRLLLVLGPGIGIGDEILCAPAATALARACPDAEITVLSGYDGLWKGVDGVDVVTSYRDLAELVAITRGDTLGVFDGVMVVDFEKPALLGAMGAEPGPAWYAELALGARGVWALDKERRWLHHHQPPAGYFDNYYALLRQLLGWLMPTIELAAPGASSVVERSSSPSRTVFVSPFSSKYEPDPERWSRVVSKALPSTGEISVRFDSGPNLDTERFAAMLASSVRGRSREGVQIEVARSTDQRTLSLFDAITALRSADAVICADSFAAHAAPAYGVPALVVARRGFEAWRVPGAQAYYFDDEAAISDTADGMRRVLETLFHADARMPVAADDVVTAGRTLTALLAGRGTGDIVTAYTELGRAVAYFLETPLETLEPLMGDIEYRRALAPLPPLDTIDTPQRRADIELFIRHRWTLWETSNLHKLLHRIDRHRIDRQHGAMAS